MKQRFWNIHGIFTRYPVTRLLISFFLSLTIAAQSDVADPSAGQDGFIKGIAALVSKGELADAETQLRAQLVSNPGDKSSRILLGVVLERSNRFTEAEGIYRNVLAREPDEIYALSNLAILLARTNRLPEAIVALEQILKIKPFQSATVFNLAGLYLSQNQNAKAIGLLEKSVGITISGAIPQKNDPTLLMKLIEAYLSDNKAGDAVRISEFIQRQDYADVNFLVKLAVLFADFGRFDHSRDLFEKVNKLVPGDFNVLYSLGLAYFILRDLNKANEIFQEAVRIKPDSPEVYYQLGKVARESYDLERALGLLQKAMQLRSDFPEANFTVASIYAERNEFGRALPFYERAAELDSGSVLYQFTLGTVYVKLKQYEKAHVLVNRRLAKLPDDLNLIFLRAILASDEGNYSAAKADFEAVVEQAPDNDEVLASFGILAYSRGENSRAEELLRKALELNPSSRLAHYGLGMLMVRLLKYDEAIRILESGAKRYIYDSDIFYQLFLAYQRSGRTEKANAALKEYRRLAAAMVAVPEPEKK